MQPKWNLSGGAQYAVAMPWGVVTPRLDWIYQSRQTFDPLSATEAPQQLYIIGGYSLFNAKLTYQPNDSKWQVVGSVTNLANKFYYYDIFASSGFDTTANLAPPREYSVSVRRNF